MHDVSLRPFCSDDLDWLVRQHSELYARNDGFDESFGRLVGDILREFLDKNDPSCEAGWIAQCGEQRLGSIFCVREAANIAKLRLFLLIPEARGAGLGRRLLDTCMSFARDKGYREMRLWTHESHEAACALYRKSGWQLESAKPVHSFGQDLVEQSWRYRF